VGHLRHVKKLLLAAAAALLLTAPGSGQSIDARNAAAWYIKAMQRLEAVGLSEADWKALRAYQPDSGDAPTDSVRAALARLQPVFGAIRRGSRQQFSDFGLDYSEGFGLTLPHLGPLRSITGLMSKDAMVRLHDGDAAGAASAISALYRLGGHVTNDRLSISSLVGQAIFNQADGLAQAGVDRSAFGPAESGVLLKAVTGFDERDPFDVIGALRNEQQFVVSWVREQYDDAGERAWMLDDLGLGAEAATVVAGMMLVDEAQFDAAVEETDEVMGRLVELFEMDDAAAAQFELTRIAEEIKRGEHGPLAALIVPDVTAMHKKMFEAQAAVAERAAVLRDIVEGRLSADTLANAAVWYLQAVRMLKALPPGTRAQLREIAEDPFRPVDDETAKIFAQTSEIVETLRAGSEKPRCDFSMTRGGRSAAIGAYLPMLRDAARLLHAGAVHHFQRDEAGPAADRLAVCFRLSAHLADDRQITSSLTSHVIFDTTVELTRWGLETLGTRHRAVVLEAVRAAGPRDPFGYLASQAAARQQIVDELRLGADARQQASRTSRRLDGDALLYMVVVTGRVEISLPDTEPLDDVISLEALAMTLTEAERVRRELAGNGDLEPIGRRAVPEIGRVNDRSARARTDLRRIVELLGG